MKINDLIPYENNPRNNEGAIEYVANSIKQFGFKVPIVVDKDNVIVAGHTRWLAAQALEMDEVPVVVADDLTPEQIKAFRLADNKVAEKASWDYSKLGVEIKDLLDIDLGFDLTDIGFGEFELETLTGDFEPDGFDDELVNTYAEKEQEYLAKKRVIICYSEDEEEEMKKILGLSEISKVVYDVKELSK
jgi:site-specific DNA-methyltransferase (adenine-specific)